MDEELPPGPADEDAVVGRRRDQVLKLVARGFFRELVNYGVGRDEIMRVASHLLDNLLSDHERAEGAPMAAVAGAGVVSEGWAARGELTVGDVTLRRLTDAAIARVHGWLQAPAVRDHFVPPFPDGEAALRAHFAAPERDYFTIERDGAAVGIIGGEHVDPAAGKLEMRKLVGEVALQGRGIGKRATLGFLHYAFAIRGMHKVYVHSRDINVRNINLNSRFGFELEGVFLEEAVVGGRRVDVIRMALLRPLWDALFGPR